MIQRHFDEITTDDIDALLQNEVSESRTLEYKEALPGNGREDKKEFLADVSSFANAAGGDILFGIVEKRDDQNRQTGIPASIPGLAGVNVDQEKQRLENLLRSNIDPRLPAVQIRAVDGFADGPVLLLRIRQSWNAPHMSTLDSRFYSRTSAGKYPLEVSEIRSAFALSETLPQRIRNFRDQRLARIIADETPVPLSSEPKLVLHVLPRAALESEQTLDLRTFVCDDKSRFLLAPMDQTSWSVSRFNFDGYVTGDENKDYFQLFRTGAFEVVSARIARTIEGTKMCFGSLIRRGLIQVLANSLSILTLLEIPPPASILVSLLDAKSFWFKPSDRHQVWDLDNYSYPFDRDTLLFPDLLIEDYTVDVRILLRPVFEILWQSVGHQRCLWYEEDGTWLG